MSKYYELKVGALMLYAGEGAKTGRTVDLTNIDPLIIKAFVAYLRHCCKIDENRLKFYLYCFESQNTVDIIDFWCRYLKVTKNQFTKPYVRRVNKQVTRIAPYGVLHVRYSDKSLLNKILTDMKSQLDKMGRYSSGQRGLTVNDCSSCENKIA